MTEDGGICFSYILRQDVESLGRRINGQWVFSAAYVDCIAGHLATHGLNTVTVVNLFRSENYTAGGNPRTFTAELLSILSPDFDTLPPVRIIQAFRQIRERADSDTSETNLFDGVGLVRRLQQLQSPREIG